jgi:hypothetical protein
MFDHTKTKTLEREGASEKYTSAAKLFSRLLLRKRFGIYFYES